MKAFIYKLTLLLLSLVIIFQPNPSFAGKQISVSKDFTLFTSKNLGNYLKPLFTTLDQSINSNNFTIAQYPNHWQIAMDISTMGMLIPDKQKTYDAELPDQFGNTNVTQTAEVTDNQGNSSPRLNKKGTISEPTIYGGESYSVYASPQNHYAPDSSYKSVSFAEGNDLSIMCGLPVLQFIFGFPTQTQLRFRTFFIPVQDENLWYFGFFVNQQVDQYLGLFKEEDNMGLAVNIAYQMMNRNEGFSVHSFNLGLHFSKSWNNGIGFYTGLQYENIGGTFEAVRDSVNPNDVANSPYTEVRSGAPIKFDIESFTKFRFTVGASYRTGFLEFHGDASWASQPMMSCGITFWIANFGEKQRQTEMEKIEKIEKIEQRNE